MCVNMMVQAGRQVRAGRQQPAEPHGLFARAGMSGDVFAQRHL